MSDNNCCVNDTCCEPPAIDFSKVSGKSAPDVCGSGACGCSGGVPVFDGVDPRYKHTLWIVIGINGAMFLAEMIAGQLGRSQALKADALDFLGDTVTYGLSLAVIGASIAARATAALVKGLSLSVMALWVFGSTLYHTLILGTPSADVMGGVGMLALVANLTSALLLMRYKDGDANVRSVWLCSRNDAIGNVIVMFAALGVWGSSSAWPDLLVAAVMAFIFLTSSVQILRQAWIEYSAAQAQVGIARVGAPASRDLRRQGLASGFARSLSNHVLKIVMRGAEKECKSRRNVQSGSLSLAFRRRATESRRREECPPE